MTSMWAVAPLSDDEREAFAQDLNKTLRTLIAAGKHVYLTDDTPKFGFDPQRCKFSHPLSGRSNCDESSESYIQVLASYVSLLEAAQNANPRDVSLIRLDDLFCDASLCRMAIDGHILFRDNNHFNILGSRLVGQALANRMALRGSPKDSTP
jgi:hypothetical protein